MASRGMPTASKTICIPDMEAVGMPGAPIDEIMAIKNTVITIKVLSSIP